MRPIREAISGALIILLLAALAACGTSAPPGTSAGPSHARSAASAGPGPASATAPSPTAAASAAQATPAVAVLSFRVSYPWHWPNDAGNRASIQHSYPVPPLPQLIAISAGDHPASTGERAYNRISFTFRSAFPSYQVQFVPGLTGDPSGQAIALAGDGVLQVTFRQAQAHTAGGAPSIVAQPAAHLGFSRMISWAPAGDFEGVVTYGIGIAWPNPQSDPQFAVRAIEVEKVTASGEHRYIVAIDIDATPASGPH